MNIIERTKTFPYMFCLWLGPFFADVQLTHPSTLGPALMNDGEYILLFFIADNYSMFF